MPDENKSFLSRFSIKNPIARIVYSSAPLTIGVLFKLAGLTLSPTEQIALISILATAGIIIEPAVSVAGNVLAEAISDKFFNRFSRQDILDNGDLQKAVGDAICATVLTIYDENRSIFKHQEKGLFEKVKHIFLEKIVIENKGINLNQEVLEKLAKVPTATWQNLIEELEKDKDTELNLTIEEIEALYPKNLPDIFAIPAAKFNEITVLNKNVWEKVLQKLCRLQGIATTNDKYPHFTDTITHIAEVLTQNFPELLKHTLVSNITRDGKAYANLQLKIMGEVLFYVRENNEKLAVANTKLEEIGIKINLLCNSLTNGLSVNSAEFDDKFAQINNLIIENQQIIIEAIKNLQIVVGEIKEDTTVIREDVKTIKDALPFVEIKPKESFKGFHKSFPNVPEYFTGRVDVLKQLEKTLATENQASFYGTHGLGKTRTAIEFALRHREKFDFVLFISATKGNFVNNAAVVGGEISKDIEDAMTLDAKFGLFLEYLQNRANWLIIVDNVEDILEVRGKIPKHFDGKVIYTSNLPDIYNVATSIPIEAMTQTEAELTLFRRKYEYKKLELSETSIEEQRAITAIVDKIGTLPIGLNLAGAFVHKYQRTFQEYLTDYEAFEDATFQHFDLADYYEAEYLKGLTDKEKDEYKGIAGVFLLTYQRITTPKDDSEQEKLITETTKAIMNLSVFLAPERVPEEIWKEGLKQIDETLAEASENAMCWIEVGKRLTQSAFFVRNEDEKTSTTHRLILTILQKQQKKEEKRKFAEIAVDIIDDLWVSSEFEHWKTCNRLLRHAETALNYAENLEIKTNNATRLYNQIAYYLYYLADYEKAIIYFQKTLRIAEKTIGKEHSDYAIGLNNLATVYLSQGRYDEAIEKLEEALQIAEKTIGKKHPQYAIRLNNLALVYHSQGRYDEALPFYQDALLIFEKALPENHPNIQIVRESLENCRKAAEKEREK